VHILILSQEPPFDPVAVATGNALRTHQLAEGLRAAGHRVSQAWLDRAGGKGRFRSADELRGLLQREAPDIILVSYWELLELLPFEGLPPVVLDFLAPRPLESLFETPERAGGLLRRLRVALARADLLLVGNEAQKHLLAYWLIEAGFDLRSSDPVRVVPLAGEVVPCPDRRMPENGFRLVAGGVRWPWRRDDAYREAIRGAVQEIAAAGHAIELIELGGAYRWASDDESNQGEFVTNDDRQSLRSYDDWSELLATAHIGLELGEDHIERRYSQSFRSLDFLRHGLPLLCSAGQPIATAVEATGAGWVVRSPEDIRTVLKAIVEAPETWKPRSAAALELLAKRHAPATAIAPLLEWLDTADKTPRLPGYGLPDPTPPVLGVPPFPERLARRYRLARRIALHRLLVRGETPVRTSIVVVSRHDLFPTDHGAAVKIVETARGLSRHGRDVYLVTHDRTQYWRVRNGVLESKRLPRWLALLARPEPWVKLDHYTRDLPESDAFLYQPLSDGSFFWRALWVAAKHDAACLQAEFPAYLEPCRQAADVLGIPAILVEHNVEYERLRAQVPELTSPQYDRFRAIELRLCNAANAVICVSDNDRQRLAADGVHPGRLHTIPHGIDLATFDRAVPVDVRERFCIPEDAPLLAYHGTFAYPPNRDALVMLAQEILPRLDQRGIEAHVLAIGHRPPKDLHPRIHCVGSVDQVAPWLKAADLAVVPLREGGGTRMKIIDDFAAGLPVIATPKGIEGIPAVDGVEALIRDDWDTFAAAIEQLVRNPEQAENLRRAGRALAETVDWSAIGERYLRLIDTLAR
jgi:glycosyltransferase involved in cell wall biosynthesis